MENPEPFSIYDAESYTDTHMEYSCEKVSCSVTPIRFDPEKCIGCNRCTEVCQVDILLPAAEKGGVPRVMYPGECYYCGACVMECPKEGAISLRHPLMNRARFIPAISLPQPGRENSGENSGAVSEQRNRRTEE